MTQKHAENGYRVLYHCVYLLHRSLDFFGVGAHKVKHFIKRDVSFEDWVFIKVKGKVLLKKF